MNFDQDRTQDDFDFEDDENEDPFDMSQDVELLYCFGCFGIMGTVNNLTALRQTEDWIRDSNGRVFSTHICESCIEKISNEDMSLFQMNPMLQENTNHNQGIKAEGGKSKVKYNDLMKSMNLKTRLTQLKKGDADACQNSDDNQ